MMNKTFRGRRRSQLARLLPYDGMRRVLHSPLPAPFFLLACLLSAGPMSGVLAGADYRAIQTVEDGLPVVRLENPQADVVVSIAPSVGNIAYEFKASGRNFLFFPAKSLAEFARQPRLAGNPFLWPWANRLENDVIPFDGNEYRLNPELENFRRDAAGQPIHGLVAFGEWEVVELRASDREATVTSRLDFYRHPDWMAHFPFASRVEMTYRLSGSELEVRTRVENLSAETMPLSLGYHPYFQVHDAPRDEWTVRVPARSLWKLSDKLLPTGETEPSDSVLSSREAQSLAGMALDNVFGDLEREDEWARFVLAGKRERVEVRFGPQFDTAVVYAPQTPDRAFVCFEPMVGPTNAFHMARRGLYSRLETIAPGGAWEGVFRIAVSGYR